ncbi:MAG: hypothetical protein QM756_34275 [Polyangiaceae bacterium]
MGTGARTAIHRLDYDRLCREVAPALSQLLANGVGSNSPAWLTDMLSWPGVTTASERGALRAGLSLSSFGSCERLGPDLGLRDNDAWLLAVAPAENGACPSRSCVESECCPLHARGQSRVQARSLHALLGAALAECLLPPLELGAPQPWAAFLEWRALEHEPHDPKWRDWDESRLLAELEDDSLLALLLRLSKRGTLLLSGSGEGLLGWLTPRETHSLKVGLEGGLHAAGERVPDSLSRYSAYAVQTELAQARELLAKVQRAVHEAAQRHEGVALSRQT